MLFSDKDVRATYKYHTDRKWWDVGSDVDPTSTDFQKNYH